MKLAAALWLAACGHEASPPDAAIAYDTVASFPITANPQLDLLFVMDDSAATIVDAQVQLGNSLSALDLVGLDLHVGVVTSDVGSATEAGQGPDIGGGGTGSCSGQGKAGMFVDGAFATDTTMLAQQLRVGAAGCGFEQPLEAMRRAIANPGFVRDGSTLAIVFEQDEDDCSLRDPAVLGPESTTLGPLQSFRCARFGLVCDEPLDVEGMKSNCHPDDGSTLISHVSDFVTVLEARTGQVVVGGVFGPSTPITVEARANPGGGTQLALQHGCSLQIASGIAVADPAVRMNAFVDRFPLGVSTTICQPDYSEWMRALSARIKSAGGDTCLFATPTDPTACIFEVDGARVDGALTADATCAGGYRASTSATAGVVRVRCPR